MGEKFVSRGAKDPPGRAICPDAVGISKNGGMSQNHYRVPPIPLPPTVPSLSHEGMLIPAALVARNLKILYLPTTKVACTALKFLIAQAEGSLNVHAMETLTTAAVTPMHTVHNPIVSGLTLFRELEADEQQHILQAHDWWRVGAIRNPYARMYSSWENRVLLRAPSLEIDTYECFEDVLVDGCIDLGASFSLFMQQVIDNPTLVNRDDHFKSQTEAIRPGVISLTHVLQVEKEGALQGFVQSLSERAGKVLELQKLNEGLRINYKEVVTPHAAQLIERWSELDFAGSIYEHEEFSLSKTAVVLSERETKLIRYIREVSGRLDVVATEMQTRVSALEHQVHSEWLAGHDEWLIGLSRQGARYGLKEILRRVRRGLRD